jgi:hypothetical protein
MLIGGSMMPRLPASHKGAVDADAIPLQSSWLWV